MIFNLSGLRCGFQFVAALDDFAVAVVDHFRRKSAGVVDLEMAICGNVPAPSLESPHERPAVISAAGEDNNALVPAVVNSQRNLHRPLGLCSKQGGAELHDVNVRVDGRVVNPDAEVPGGGKLGVGQGDVPLLDLAGGEFDIRGSSTLLILS